jgi:glycosyltransferase involved in cell wall biosynthesis
MDEGSLVTCVMIFLNGEKYIAEAIDSILAQTYRNWELVLVDDGSTDGATSIAQDYAQRHPDRVRYIDHPGHENRGMSASRNAGVRAGRGQFVSFLDADDVWLPDRLEKFIKVAGRFPEAGMIYGPTLYWSSWAEERGVAPPVEGQADFVGHLDLPVDRLIPPPVAMRRFLTTMGGCLPGICSLLISRDAYDDIGGFESEFRGLYEDQVFLSKMTLAYSVVVIAEVLDKYRQHSESCCYRSAESGEYHADDYHPARFTYLEWLRTYCRTNGIADAVIDREIRRQTRPYRWPIIIHATRFATRFGKKGKAYLQRVLPARVTRRAQSALDRMRDRRRDLRARKQAASAKDDF